MRYVLIALLLAGCATTPKDVMESGTRTVHVLKSPPSKAALCMARNVENFHAGMVASVRPGDVGQEVIARLTAAESVIFVVHVEPTNTGSRAVVWYRGYLVGGESVQAAMLAGC